MKNLFRVRRYETSSHIKKEFVEFLKWSQPTSALSDEEYNKKVDSYFEEKNIALTGEIRKLHDTNNRNATTELLFAIGAMILGIGLAIVLIYYFGDSFNNFMKNISK